MAGSQFTCYPITDEQAAKIRKRQRKVNKVLLYTAGAGILTLAAESIYRNFGVSPEAAKYIFQTGGYTLLATIFGGWLNNHENVVGPETSEKESLESKVEVSN